MFVSVDGKAKKVAEIFAGGTDGKAHKITELFGSVGGIAKQLFTTTPPEPNGFDKYNWDEIKQLADEGKLLEHFNLYDKVTIKLKTPLTSTMHIYMTGYGVYEDIPQCQTEMMFQIVELTETKMRLMCPRVNALGTANSSLSTSTSVVVADHWEQYANDFTNDTGTARMNTPNAWGMTDMYTKLKIIQNSLPDDLVNVLSVCARPLIRYERHFITEALETEFDEDMKVRQVTTNIWDRSVDTSDYYVVKPIIEQSYYPTTVGEYLYHIKLPMEYDTYKQRRYMAGGMFKGLRLLDYQYYIYNNLQTPTKAAVKVSWTDTPYASCYFSKGITTNAEYEAFLDAGGLSNGNNPPISGYGTIFPEIIIEKS